MVPVELSRIVINERSDEQLIFLREQDGPREFRMVLRIFEALTIDRLVKEIETSRPLTHDLLTEVIDQLGGQLDRILIDDHKDGVFYAKLVVVQKGEEIRIDSRPSDGIALALKTEAPIYVKESVLEACANQES